MPRCGWNTYAICFQQLISLLYSSSSDLSMVQIGRSEKRKYHFGTDYTNLSEMVQVNPGKLLQMEELGQNYLPQLWLSRISFPVCSSCRTQTPSTPAQVLALLPVYCIFWRQCHQNTHIIKAHAAECQDPVSLRLLHVPKHKHVLSSSQHGETRQRPLFRSFTVYLFLPSPAASSPVL